MESPRTASSADDSCGGQRQALLDCLDELATLPGADPATCRWLREKLSSALLNLVVVGQFKRGKSTLINALIGRALLPTGVVPLTSFVTLVQYGAHPAASLEFLDGRRCEIAPEAARPSDLATAWLRESRLQQAPLRRRWRTLLLQPAVARRGEAAGARRRGGPV